MNQTWKILIYIAADNTLYEDALVSLRQLTEASRLGKVEILVQFDGPNSDLASRFRCKDGRKELLWQAGKNDPVDRGKRLESFLAFFSEPAYALKNSRILLILWGHGAGIDHVYVYNDLNAPAAPVPPTVVRNGIAFHTKDLLNADNANVYVSNIKVGEILGEFAKKLEKKIDILAFDACLMGMAEICHEVRDSVSLLVASDEEIPQSSYPYDTIVSDLETYPGMDARTLATVMVSRYVERFAPDETAEGNPLGLSLSMYDLAACKGFATAFKGLVDAICAGLYKGTTMAQIVRARDFSRTPLEASYIDLAVFLDELTVSFPKRSAIHQSAAEALEALQSLPTSSITAISRKTAQSMAAAWRSTSPRALTPSRRPTYRKLPHRRPCGRRHRRASAASSSFPCNPAFWQLFLRGAGTASP